MPVNIYLMLRFLRLFEYPNGQLASYQYSKRGELKGVSFSDGEEFNYHYDQAGNMIEAKSKDSHEKYTYDSLNRVTEFTNFTLEKTVKYSYDAVGNRTQIMDAEERVMQYQYNDLNQLTAFTDPDGNMTEFEYEKAGQISKIKRPSGITSEYSYNNNSWLTGIKYVGADYLSSYSYDYDKVGNRIQQKEEDGAVTSFDYDALYRLTKVHYPKDKIDQIRTTYYTPPHSNFMAQEDDGTENTNINGKNDKSKVKASSLEIPQGKGNDKAMKGIFVLVVA